MTFTGLTIKMTTPPITPPMYGPKYGIILVMPTITLSSTAYGKRKIVVHTKQIIPIIRESIALPIIKLEKILPLSRRILRVVSASALA